MNELDALFGDLGAIGLVEDVKFYLPYGAGAVGGVVVWRLANKHLGSFIPDFPGKQYVMPVAEIVAGAFLGNLIRKRGGMLEKIGTGLTIGMTMDGLTALLRGAPVVGEYLSGMDGFGLAALGEEDLFNRYLNAAPTSVEEVNGAPVTVEEAVAGVDEEVHAVIM